MQCFSTTFKSEWYISSILQFSYVIFVKFSFGLGVSFFSGIDCTPLVSSFWEARACCYRAFINTDWSRFISFSFSEEKLSSSSLLFLLRRLVVCPFLAISGLRYFILFCTCWSSTYTLFAKSCLISSGVTSLSWPLRFWMSSWMVSWLLWQMESLLSHMMLFKWSFWPKFTCFIKCLIKIWKSYTLVLLFTIMENWSRSTFWPSWRSKSLRSFT